MAGIPRQGHRELLWWPPTWAGGLPRAPDFPQMAQQARMLPLNFSSSPFSSVQGPMLSQPFLPPSTPFVSWHQLSPLISTQAPAAWDMTGTLKHTQLPLTSKSCTHCSSATTATPPLYSVFDYSLISFGSLYVCPPTHTHTHTHTHTSRLHVIALDT